MLFFHARSGNGPSAKSSLNNFKRQIFDVKLKRTMKQMKNLSNSIFTAVVSLKYGTAKRLRTTALAYI